MTRPGSAVRRRIASLSEAIASRLWPLPLVAVIAGVILGVALPVIDRAVDASLPSWVGTFVFSGGVDAARAVLSAIAGSLITAASLTFSLTVVALQLASSQASPRLLRMFASDRMVHATLAMFLGTFAYALTVLRTVEDATTDADAFVPRIALTTASVLTLSSVVVLTFFLAHLARQLRVETMMRDVHREASETITRMAGDVPGEPADAPARPEHARTVPAPASGFITGVDREQLVLIAQEADVVVRELRTVGENVVEGTPLVEWWPADPMVRPDGEAAQTLADRLSACFSAAYERTPPQDVGFGLRQLADVASKALSPGVNDPTTAVHALGHIAAILADLADHGDTPAAWADADGAPRLISAGGRFEQFAEVGLQQIRRYGTGDPDVVARLFGALDDVAWRARSPQQRDVLAGQLERLEASVAEEDYDDVERSRFAALGARVRGTLGRT